MSSARPSDRVNAHRAEVTYLPQSRQADLERPAPTNTDDLALASEVTPSRVGSAVVARRSIRRLVLQVVVIVAAVGLLQLLVSTSAVSPAAVAAPSSVARALGPVLSSSSFWSAVWETVESWAIGLALSAVIAMPIGFLLGVSELGYRMFRFTIDFLRTIPPVAIIPLALLLYGATEEMAVVVIVFGSIWPVMLQSMYGVHDIDPVARAVARAYRFRRRERLFGLVIPSAAPFVATGIRVAATMSLLLAVGSELISGAPGIGAAIATAQTNGDIPQMYVFVVASAVLGLLLNLAMLRLERRALRWHPSHRAAVAS